MIIQCGSRPWTFGQTVVSDRPVSSIWTVILELITFTWDLSWLKVQQLTMSMSMSSTNLVFLFLSTWHQRFLEAVAFFDLIGGARQGHWDKFQSAVSSHSETRLLIGSIHFLHLTFESISKPIKMSRVSHTDESYLFDFIFKLFEISSTFHLRRQFDFHQLVQSNQINNIVLGAFRCKQLDDIHIKQLCSWRIWKCLRHVYQTENVNYQHWWDIFAIQQGHFLIKVQKSHLQSGRSEGMKVDGLTKTDP